MSKIATALLCTALAVSLPMLAHPQDVSMPIEPSIYPPPDGDVCLDLYLLELVDYEEYRECNLTYERFALALRSGVIWLAEFRMLTLSAMLPIR